MCKYIIPAVIIAVVSQFATCVYTGERTISEEELNDKISAVRLGQLVGNYCGLHLKTIL